MSVTNDTLAQRRSDLAARRAANQSFEIDLPMRVMFDDPAIAALSLLLEEALIEQLEATPN